MCDGVGMWVGDRELCEYVSGGQGVCEYVSGGQGVCEYVSGRQGVCDRCGYGNVTLFPL